MFKYLLQRLEFKLEYKNCYISTIFQVLTYRPWHDIICVIYLFGIAFANAIMISNRSDVEN